MLHCEEGPSHVGVVFDEKNPTILFPVWEFKSLSKYDKADDTISCWFSCILRLPELA